jgi:hypothetical protein
VAHLAARDCSLSKPWHFRKIVYLSSINGKNINMNARKAIFYLPLLLALGCVVLCGSCKRKPASPEGRIYWYQSFWEGGPSDFSPYGEFKEGGAFVHHDDTATFTGTWSNVEETVVWSINNPPKNTRFRGTFEDKGINGNMEDDLGGKGWFQGSRRD